MRLLTHNLPDASFGRGSVSQDISPKLTHTVQVEVSTLSLGGSI